LKNNFKKIAMTKNRNKNRYQQNAKKKSFLAGMNEGLPTKGNVKNTLLETGKDLLIGVIGGGFIGAAIGKPSLIIGMAATGAGHFTNNKLVQLLGIGMMAANGFQSGKATNGLNGLDGVQERLKAYKETFAEKVYLDKLLKKNAKAAATNGFGAVQYFNYENELNGELASLDNIERQIEDSGMQHLQIAGDFGMLNQDAMMATDGVEGLEMNEIIF
jgi:hypothetical protein